MKDAGTSFGFLKADVRLHPDPLARRLIRAVRYENRDFSRIARQWHWKRRKLIKFYEQACSELNQRVKCWIEKLPKYKIDSERRKREVPAMSGWIGQIPTGPFPDRDFHKLFPNLESLRRTP